MEEAPGEVGHVLRPSDPRIHVLDANEAADGDNGSVAAEAITWKKINQQLCYSLCWHSYGTTFAFRE